VLATGFHYPGPIKNNDVILLADRKRIMATESIKIKNARSILIVGSGPVGIEFTGELLHSYGG
jgi:NADH dehydrogenase FAD-containing subunit